MPCGPGWTLAPAARIARTSRATRLLRHRAGLARRSPPPACSPTPRTARTAGSRSRQLAQPAISNPAATRRPGRDRVEPVQLRQGREDRRARHGGAGLGLGVHEHRAGVVEGPRDLRAGEHRRRGQGAVGERLGADQHVRWAAPAVAGEVAAGAAEPGGYLVGYDEVAMLGASAQHGVDVVLPSAAPPRCRAPAPRRLLPPGVRPAAVRCAAPRSRSAGTWATSCWSTP